jgi:prevent-host-death family protein
MLEIDVTDASITLDQLLSEVEHGNEITIIRHGQPVARLSPILQTLREAKLPPHPLYSRHPLRALQSQASTSTLETLQTLRQEARY